MKPIPLQNHPIPVKTSGAQKILLVIFSLIIIELLMHLGGFTYNFFQREQNPLVNANRTEKVILCIGESTTALGFSESFPAQLQTKLDSRYGKHKYLVANEGVNATNTAAILENLKPNIEKYKPDIIISMMGINDVWAISNQNSIWENVKILKLFNLIYINLKESYEQHQASQKISAEVATKVSLQAQAYDEVAVRMLEQGEMAKAEPYFRKYLSKENTAEAYSHVGLIYLNRYGIAETEARLMAQKYFKESLRLDPDNLESLRSLAMIYLSQYAPDATTAQVYLERAYWKLGARDADVLSNLAEIYMRQGRSEEAIEVLKSGLYASDDTIQVWDKLIVFYGRMKKFEIAENYIDLALKKFPNNPRIYAMKQLIFQLQGKVYDFSEQDKSYSVKNYSSYPPTQKNYLLAAEIIRNYGVRHIVMQYPRRDTTEFKELLKGYPDIVFVENKVLFEEALKTKETKDLFTDMFGGDFGHATALGNSLIADQIIKTMQAQGLL